MGEEEPNRPVRELPQVEGNPRRPLLRGSRPGGPRKDRRGSRGLPAFTASDPRSCSTTCTGYPRPHSLEEKADAFGGAPRQEASPQGTPGVGGGRPGVNIRNAVNMALREG